MLTVICISLLSVSYHLMMAYCLCLLTESVFVVKNKSVFLCPTHDVAKLHIQIEAVLFICNNIVDPSEVY